MSKQIYDFDRLPALLDVETVALLLTCKKPLVRKMLRDGRIKGTKIGKEWRICKTDVLAFVGQEEKKPTEIIAFKPA